MLLSPHAATLAAGTVSGILPDQTGSFQECSEIAIDDGVDKILKDVDGELHLVIKNPPEKPLRSRLLDRRLLKSVDATLRLFLNAQIGQRAIDNSAALKSVVELAAQGVMESTKAQAQA